jgi:hypothetical protein
LISTRSNGAEGFDDPVTAKSPAYHDCSLIAFC